MKRLVAVAATMVLALTACTGGGDDKDDKESGPSLPIPAKAPSARGAATGPALEPKVLLESSDELEEQAGSLDSASVERRSGAFISGRTAVGYAVDNISGYDLDSGEQLWTSKLDLGGGTVCFVSQPDRAVKTFTVAYGKSGYCPDLATIRVSDGKVMSISKTLSDLQEFEGDSAGGPVTELLTIKGRDYVLDFRGVVWKMVKGEPEPLQRLETGSYFTIAPTPEGDTLIGARLSDRGRCRVDAYALPSFERMWTEDSASLFPDVREDCIISPASGNPAWMVQQDGSRYSMIQVDPDTGKVVGKADAATDSGGKAAEGEFDLSSAANQFDRALGLPGGDMVFAQVRGLTRYSLETGKVAWDLDLGQVELESAEDYPLTTVLPQGVTADGYLVATVSNNTAAEVIAVQVKTGKLVARWAVPADYGNGFQVEPGMTLFGDGLVLSRNFDSWKRTFADYLDLKEPEGPLYDIGIFTFPEPDSSTSPSVPTSGPTDTDAKALAGITTPEGATGERSSGAFSTGSRLVSYTSGTVTGFDTKSGKEKWSFEVDADDPGAKVCASEPPDQAVKTFTIAYQGSGKGDTCNTLLRVDAADGSELDRIQLPAPAKVVTDMVVRDKVVYVVSDGRDVRRIDDGAFVDVGTLARKSYPLQPSPEDPSLFVSTTSLKGGREWAIDAYRLPAFERVWSTTASKVLGKVDRRSPVSSWQGNPLWISTVFGDLSDPTKKVDDSLVLLDPDTGRVVSRTGRVERDYLADDLKKFTVLGAAPFQTVGLDNGDVVMEQQSGVMRYSLAEKKIRWAVDTSSIVESMERDRKGSYLSQHFDLIEGGKTVLATLSNDVSVELMTLDAATGKITGRWNIPKDRRNGLQSSPEVAPFSGGVALSRSDYAYDYAYAQTGRKVPSDPQYDVGLFALSKPKK
ncbi:outer membrane protein assembly factor BamB family protein [Aeromicrobium stalagmiti]|uniref:outer membrane protein assembly factor BamB family protein n=1 Tax=Aeromicrobium stalagmiti TaxID=2738988 RepID=UPI00156A16A2|nr:PQQ-binding-like beta-propeller repeat protein [Aeromicrobium stalagmiti]NRQ50978.1 PQQ-binding-like beta-propeller repeat protein [Aeromicrobium stalagmiti]